MTTTDAQGNELRGAGAEGIRAFDSAVDHLLHFRSEVMPAVEESLTIAPSLAMATVLGGYLRLMGTEPVDAASVASEAHVWAEGARDHALTARERMHHAAVGAWAEGDMARAGAILEEVTRAHPRDLVALAVGHQIDFLSGDALRLRDRVGGALRAWDRDDPFWGTVQGMYAFGLEEAGHYDRSEYAALAAVEADPTDVWGIHATIHTYEMQGRSDTGMRFLEERTARWASGNYLNVHNWWHFGLFLLDSGREDQALQIYDAVLHNDASEGLAMEMLDAAALLWRLLLDGSDQSTRWRVLADAWEPTAQTPHYAFNDVHAVMAFVGAGRFGAAEALVADREAWLARGPAPTATNVAMTREVGLPVAKALIAHARGRHEDVVALLAPIRRRVHEFGGSHAQRDAVQRTLLASAIRAGQHDLAATLASERISVRPCNPWTWLRRAELSDALGQEAAAALARTTAQQQRAHLAAAAPAELAVPARS